MDQELNDAKDEVIIENIELNIWEALIPVIALVGMSISLLWMKIVKPLKLR